MILVISGFAGCGKSTLAKGIGSRLGLKVILASRILKELATKKPKEIIPEKIEMSKSFWETKQGIKLVKKRLADKSMDMALDKMLLEIISKDNAVIDSKTMCYLSPTGTKIWLEAGLETRAKRIAERDNIPVEEARKKISDRDNADAKIYKQLYGFDLGKGTEKFFVINNEKTTPEKTLEKAIEIIKKTRTAKTAKQKRKKTMKKNP